MNDEITTAFAVKTETPTRLDNQNTLNMHENTDTPRTDAAASTDVNGLTLHLHYVPTEFARQLERELAASEAEVERKNGELSDLECEVWPEMAKLKDEVAFWKSKAHEAEDREGKREAEVEKLQPWKNNLISNLMALEIYEHKHEDNPAVALAAYGQWNWNAGEWEAPRK